MSSTRPYRPAFGGAVITTTDPTSQAVPRGNASGFIVNFAGNGWLAVTNSATPIAMTTANSAPVVAGTYGPFDLANVDTHIHVGGRGATPVAVIMLL